MININLTQETANGTERVYNIDVDGNTLKTSWGLETQEELNSSVKVIEDGKAGRTIEEETIVQAWRKAKSKTDGGYEGDYDELEDAYQEVLEAVELRKEEALAEKEAEKAKLKAEKEAEKARLKAEKEAETTEAEEAVTDEEVAV